MNYFVNRRGGILIYIWWVTEIDILQYFMKFLGVTKDVCQVRLKLSFSDLRGLFFIRGNGGRWCVGGETTYKSGAGGNPLAKY